MIREEICTGKSIEEAIEAACAKLGVNQDDRNVSVEVLEMPVRKLFRTIPAKAKPNQTEPTGFSAVPPVGPAMPETDTARSAPAAFFAPAAISITVSRLTAPCFSRV